MGRGQSNAEELFYGSDIGGERSEEPQLVVLPNGIQEWRLNEQLHREDGPARVHKNGDIEYWRRGKLDSGDPKKPVAVYFSAIGKTKNTLAEWADSEGNISCIVGTPAEETYNHKFMMDVLMEHDMEALQYLQQLANEIGPLEKAGIGSIEWFDEEGNWYREDAPSCVNEYRAHWINPDKTDQDKLVSVNMSDIRRSLEEKYGREY